ncbi:hypothetical protein FRC12_023314 [Ceratobasidium sp. 428]|nr:hypothetical protein FRC12_023314 [Ceratobasidium sp. 428]
MSRFGENGTICASASFFTDHTELLTTRKPGDVIPTRAESGAYRGRRAAGESLSSKCKVSNAGAGSGKGSKQSRGGPAAPMTYENIIDAEHDTQWLIVLRKNGFFEIWTLPSVGLAFSTDQLEGLLDVLVDSGQVHAAL